MRRERQSRSSSLWEVEGTGQGTDRKTNRRIPGQSARAFFLCTTTSPSTHMRPPTSLLGPHRRGPWRRPAPSSFPRPASSGRPRLDAPAPCTRHTRRHRPEQCARTPAAPRCRRDTSGLAATRCRDSCPGGERMRGKTCAGSGHGGRILPRQTSTSAPRSLRASPISHQVSSSTVPFIDHRTFSLSLLPLGGRADFSSGEGM